MKDSVRTDQKILEALRSIIAGDVVKRNKHELLYDGRDLTTIFTEQLNRQGYIPTTVGEVHVEPGERVPAFIVKEKVRVFRLGLLGTIYFVENA